MSLNLSLSISKTDDILSLIMKGKGRMFLPICNDLAYLDCNITNKESCHVNIGEDYFIKTSIGNAQKIIQRRNDYENDKGPLNNRNLTKLDDDTFEIIEKDEIPSQTIQCPIEMNSNNNNNQKDIIEEKRITMLTQQNIPKESATKVNEANEMKAKSGRDFLLSLIQQNKTKSSSNTHNK